MICFDIDEYPVSYNEYQQKAIRDIMPILNKAESDFDKGSISEYSYSIITEGLVDKLESVGIKIEYNTYGHRHKWFAADRAWAEAENDWLMDLANDDEPDPIDEWVAYDPYEGM